MSVRLNSIVRRILIEAEGTEPEDPSYWREVGKEVGRWGDAASDLAGTVAKATLDTFVGQAHAPGSEEDVQIAKSREVTITKLIGQMAEMMLPHLAMTKFRISAKIMDSVGFPAREIIAGKYGDEVLKDIYTGSVLHDILESTAMVPGGVVPSMLLDSVVYASEGNRKAAIATLAMAALFGEPKAQVALGSEAGARQALATPTKYSGLSSSLRGSQRVAVVSGQDAAASAAVRIGLSIEKAGVSGGQRMGQEAASAIKSGAVDASPALNSSRVAQAESAATELMTRRAGGETPLAQAKRKWGEVTVDKPVVVDSGRRDVLAGGSLTKRSWFGATPERMIGSEGAREAEAAAMRRAQGVMQSAQFVTQAKRLYRNIGNDVNIKPIAGSMKTVFEETDLAAFTTTRTYKGQEFTSRVTLTTNAEALPVFEDLGVSASGLSSNSTTIVPVANAAGVDTLPTAWMMGHAIFDGGTGNLLLQSMPRTKAIVDEVVEVFNDLRSGVEERTTLDGSRGKYIKGSYEYEVDRFMKDKYNVPSLAELDALDKKISELETAIDKLNGPTPDALQKRLTASVSEYYAKESLRKKAIAAQLSTLPAEALGLSVNSNWGRNSRALITQELEGVASGKSRHGDITRLTAPSVGQDVSGGTGALKSLRSGSEIEGQAGKTQASIMSAGDYADRPQIDNVSEILTAALTKQEGYVPDLSHVPLDHPHRKMIEDAAAKIQKITADLPEAFAADTRGKVVWVAVN